MTFSESLCAWHFKAGGFVAAVPLQAGLHVL